MKYSIFLVVALTLLSEQLCAQNISFQQIASPFTSVFLGEQEFADLDGDNDLDLIITGKTQSAESTRLYLNDGTGTFTAATGTPFVNLGFSALAVGDIDGDQDLDVIVSGRNNSSLRQIDLFENDSLGNFTLLTGSSLDATIHGFIKFFDYDMDNDLDFLIDGSADVGTITQLYENDGSGLFTHDPAQPFDSVQQGCFDYSDVDNDGDLDLLLTGSRLTVLTAKLYLNDSLGNYTVATGQPFTAVSQGYIQFADVDGDLDEDVLILGNLTTKLYDNDGNGNFTLVNGTPFPPLQQGAIAFFDPDNDNDLDVMLNGYDGSTRVCKLFENNGSGGFSEVLGLPFLGTNNGRIKVADIDNDGDQDVLISGQDNTAAQVTILYRNTSCPNRYSTTSINACHSYTVPSGDETYTTSQTVFDTIPTSGGCDSILTIHLTINASTSDSLHVSACDSYTVPSGDETYYVSGLVSDTIQTIGGCDSVLIIDVAIDSVNLGIDTTGSLISASQDSAIYQWLYCDSSFAIIPGANGQTYTPSASGNYSVIVIYKGCTDTTNCVNVSVTSIQNYITEKDIVVFPNPTNSKVNIEINTPIDRALVSIMDLTGRVTMSRTYSDAQFIAIEVKEPAGIYILSIETEEGQEFIKLVKE